MTSFTYNGKCSADFGLHIEKKDVFSAPSYDAEFTSMALKQQIPNCYLAMQR